MLASGHARGQMDPMAGGDQLAMEVSFRLERGRSDDEDIGAQVPRELRAVEVKHIEDDIDAEEYAADNPDQPPSRSQSCHASPRESLEEKD